jgi:hypothetical protein
MGEQMLLVEPATKLIDDTWREEMRIRERNRVVEAIRLTETKAGIERYNGVQRDVFRGCVIDPIEAVRLGKIVINTQSTHILA